MQKTLRYFHLQTLHGCPINIHATRVLFCFQFELPRPRPHMFTFYQQRADGEKKKKRLAQHTQQTPNAKHWFTTSFLQPLRLGDSGGVVNSLDFCPASLKSLGCFYFRCILSSQWKVVTVNLRILHCQH